MVTGGVAPVRGFTLAEVLVAMVVLGAGVLVIAASTGTASAMLRRAEARDRAVEAAAAVFDSLAAEPDPAAGERHAGPVHLRWEVLPDGATSLIRLVATTAAEPAEQGTVFEMRWAPPPPSLVPVP